MSRYEIANVEVDAQLGVDDLDEGEWVVVTADGKMPLETCDVNAVNDTQGKVPGVQVVDVHDVLHIVLLVEVAIFDVVLLFIDVVVVPIFAVVLLRE